MSAIKLPGTRTPGDIPFVCFNISPSLLYAAVLRLAALFPEVGGIILAAVLITLAGNYCHAMLLSRPRRPHNHNICHHLDSHRQLYQILNFQRALLSGGFLIVPNVLLSCLQLCEAISILG